MATTKPEWFLAPRDIKPNTTITLGKLICNPRMPEGPPYLDSALPVPPTDTTEFNYPWTREINHVRTGTIDILTSFLANVGGGSDIGAQFERQRKTRIEAARLHTVKFEPGDEYLEKALNLPMNLKYLRETRFRKPVYVVTGVKTAYSGRTSTSEVKQFGGEGSMGTIVNFGAKVGLKQIIEANEEIGDTIDFVFAFRLNKVHYSRRKESLVQETFNKGALFSHEANFDDVETVSLEPEEVDVDDDKSGAQLLEIEEECSGQEEFGISGQEALDESGEACIIVAP